MTKKEIAEIKRLYQKDNSITRICTCYVNNDKEKVSQTAQTFGVLPDEDALKHIEILRKTLSGSMDKNLFTVEFPLEQEQKGGTQDFLYALKKSQLKDDKLLLDFYDRVIENYSCNDNYYIVLIHNIYDVPGKASDGEVMDDASDFVYEHLICSICPVRLSKEGLSYHADSGKIEARSRDWVVDAPEIGFLYPAFTDRMEDIHSSLYYSKKDTDFQEAFIDNILGSTLPMPVYEQKETFSNIVQEALGKGYTFDVARDIHTELNEFVIEKKNEGTDTLVDADTVEKILFDSGIKDEALQSIRKEYAEAFAKPVEAQNLYNPRAFAVSTGRVQIKADPDYADTIETRMIDGRMCFVIPVDDTIAVNGVDVRMNGADQ